MRIAVVTPYCHETHEQLRRCHDSVINQTVKCDHFLVSDGFPMAEVDAWACTHIKVPHHNDYGDTPRLIGTSSAATLGYDAILLLDGDNWFNQNHVETLLHVQASTQADVVTCARTLLRAADLSPLGVCFESDGVNFNDTNCYLIMKKAFPLFRAWAFKDPKLGIVGDRIFWNCLKAVDDIKVVRSPAPTVNYVTTFGFHYTMFGEEPPENAKEIVRLAEGGFEMMKSADVRKMVQAAEIKIEDAE
jgi:hypothetical protein